MKKIASQEKKTMKIKKAQKCSLNLVIKLLLNSLILMKIKSITLHLKELRKFIYQIKIMLISLLFVFFYFNRGIHDKKASMVRKILIILLITLPLKFIIK